MFKSFLRSGRQDALAAYDLSLTIIEFDASATVIIASGSFCKTMGYELPAILGRNHSFFVEPSYAQSSDYR